MPTFEKLPGPFARVVIERYDDLEDDGPMNLVPVTCVGPDAEKSADYWIQKFAGSVSADRPYAKVTLSIAFSSGDTLLFRAVIGAYDRTSTLRNFVSAELMRRTDLETYYRLIRDEKPLTTTANRQPVSLADALEAKRILAMFQSQM